MKRDAAGPVWVLGGSGVVGRAAVPLVSRVLGRPVVIVGRSEEKAAPVLSAVREAGGDARFLSWDIATPPPNEPASALLCVVNDPQDGVLDAAMRAGLPLVDIARWTSRAAGAAGRIALASPRSPVLLASGWMGGLAARVVSALAARLGPLDEAQLSVRYALADASGEDSVEYMDRLWVPFESRIQGERRLVMPLSGTRSVSIAGKPTVVSRIDTPEQWSLPMTLGLNSCELRIGFDQRAAAWSLRALHRLGVFWWLRGERFQALRRSLLRAPGSELRPGQDASFRVEVVSKQGERRAVSLVDPAGQAHCTAVGAVLGLRAALQDGAPRGLFFPEQDPQNASLLEELPGFGVQVFHEETGDDPARSRNTRGDLRREPGIARA